MWDDGKHKLLPWGHPVIVDARYYKVQILAKAIGVWLEMTPTIMDSRYYGITDTFLVPKWQFYWFDSQ